MSRWPSAPVDASTPVFRYYTFGSTTPMASPVTGDALGTIAAVQVSFKALPSRATDPNTLGNVVFQDRITVREVDPNASNPEPDCE